jgi:DNA processing protein
MITDKDAAVGFSYLDCVGPKSILRMEDFFGCLAEAWSGSPAALREALGAKQAEQVYQHCHNFSLQKAYDVIYRQGVRVIELNEADYPARIRAIFDPPRILYLKGAAPLREFPVAIGMVGARNCTSYGRAVAYNLAKELGEAGVLIVSGLARGIDTESHKGAVAGGSVTWAVLGCGVDICYPAENKLLYDQIVSTGAIWSEFPLGKPPLPFNFPRRNRLISGLVDGVVVVEAAEKSGTLITVDFALEQGRDVYAVPGNITSSVSKGTNRLLQQGAKLMTKAADILEDYRIAPAISIPREAINLSAVEQSVVDGVVVQSTIDDIIATTGLPAENVRAALVRLELKGLLRMVPDGHYVKIANI